MLYIPLTWLAYSKEHYAGQNSWSIIAEIFKFFPIENENPFSGHKIYVAARGGGMGGSKIVRGKIAFLQGPSHETDILSKI
jgi:hypothetical protein